MCLALFAQANISDIQFKHYSVADGLSQSTVTDIIEDKQGFMWFATTDGLNRFDGYEFVKYHFDADTPSSLPGQFVRKLFIDRNDNLWVATYSGLGRYIKEQDAFKVYNVETAGLKSEQIWTIGETAEGELLISDKFQVYTYSNANDAFTPLEFSGSPPPSDVRLIFGEADRTWLGTDGNGIFILDNASNQVFDLSQNNPWNINVDAKYLFDLKILNENIWLATERGVYVFSSDGLLIQRLHSQSEHQLPSDAVRSIEVFNNNSVWLGTSDGIGVTNINAEPGFNIGQENELYVGLKDLFIIKLYQDSNNTLWIGTYSSGIHQYNKSFANYRHFTSVPYNEKALSNNMIWAFAEADNGQIWIATQSGGLNLFDPQSGNFERFLQGSPHSIFDLALDDQQNLWLGTSNGVLVYKKQGDALIQVNHFYQGIMVDQLGFVAGKVWAWPSAGQLTFISPEDMSIETVELPNQSFSTVVPLYVDSNDNIWIQTNLGTAIYNTVTKQFNQLIINIKNVQPHFLAIKEFEDGFWAATKQLGLLKLDKYSYQVEQRIHDLPELKNTQFNTAIIDDTFIWLSSIHKVLQVSLETGQIAQHINSEMLDYNDLNEGAGIVTSAGQLLFGGTKGFHVFKSNAEPQKRPGTATSVPVITALEIFNRPVTVSSDNSPLSAPIHISDSITLENKASPFSLEFAQINSVNPTAESYRYRLNGLNSDWLLTNSANRKATYTNLMFGTYVFEVQSSVEDGPWSDSASLEINILPPIWLHQNAMVAYAFVLLLLVSYWIKQYKAKLASQRAIKESEERLKLTLWSSGDELWDWDIYRGQVFRANTWGTLDFPQDDIRANSSYQANIHMDDIPKVQKALKEHLDNDTDHFQVTYRAKTFKGEWIWLLDRGKVVHRDNNNQPIRMTGTLKNISHLKQAEEQLKLFKRSIETISDGVFIADTDFRFISVNNSYCGHTGETREQALASYLKFHQYPDAFTEEVKKSLQQRGNWNGEVESRRTNGEKYEMELNIDAIQGEDGKITHYVGVFSDITSRKSTEKELLKLANTDPLTEMPNRSFFQASHMNLVRKQTPHALICLDMDNFKKINDSLGHQTGDILIKQIGKRLQKIAGTDLTCYRLGGDEFAILIDNTTDMHRITHFAQRVLDDMARPFLINKQEFVLGASVGIAFYPEDGHTPQELLKNADTAMYFAKNAGGNKYQFFSGEMNQNAVRQLQIENLIRNGLKEDLFTVFYQPKVDIATGKLVSMEALVRFEHPDKGIVSPAQFIPLAEETGQIIDIGERVLQKACEDTKRWVSQGLFTGRVAINISARQFELPDLDDRIDKILQKIGLSPLHLECEITEGTLMQNPDQALRMMDRLREKGIHLALDDFGTGYSSLAYLKKFPLNTLKIDKAFIDDIAHSNVDKHMTASIINIAHNLGLKVVAEGVEQEEQLSILRRYDCEMLQGYLYSKPLSSTRFERLLKENQHIDQFIGQPEI